ncbi:MAG TPA: hypothetical protein VM261_19715 [Kofleriaceae bacterium]|nr:hypothetical protein [Kofleriaceae bacterium]
MSARHLLALALAAIAVTTTSLPAAQADMASYEREQKQKRARLVELNDLLVEAMKVEPASFTRPAEIKRAVARIEQLTTTVRTELRSGKLNVAGPLPGKVQLNLNKVDDRLAAVKLVERTAIVLARIEPIATKHGEPDPADLAETARLVNMLGDRRGAYPAGVDAMTAWRDRLLTRLAEVPWPAKLAPLELSDALLAERFLPINATVEGDREQSIAILDVAAPMRQLDRHGAELRGVHFALWGPVTERAGIVAGPMKPREWRDLEPGRYLLRAKGRGPATSFRIVLSTPATPRERMMQVGSIAADAPLEQRRADAIFPFLGDVAAAHVRQELFLRAPREAFVYARETITSDEGTFAQPDEPLLVVGPGAHGSGLRVINAQGLAVALNDGTKLAIAPTSAPALPERIDPLQLSFEMDDLQPDHEGFTAFETDAQSPIIKKYVATIERWNTCVDKVLARYGGNRVANQLAVVTYRGGKVTKVEGMSDRMWNEADRTCKTKQYEAQTAGFDRQLSDAHNAERARRLERIRMVWAK